MNRFTVNTLILVFFLGCNLSALAAWQEGEFSGELNWEGNVTQVANPWNWAQPGLPDVPPLDLRQGESTEGQTVWRGLLTRAVVLRGVTETLMPSGRTGVAPRINFGDTEQNIHIDWLKEGIARVTLPVTGPGGMADLKGSLVFSMRSGAVIIATNNTQRQGYSVVAGPEDSRNGLPPAGKAADYKQVLSLLQDSLSYATFPWLSSSVANGGEASFSLMNQRQYTAVGSAYAAEIIGGSGEISFPSGAVPSRWQVSLPVQVTYQ
ncbi:hypothetical protein NLN92_23335 [Citrobacter portucalensis]|uniref:F4 family fimbrial subunit n=1 Tax=Citrobacter portucalensis TaxID=1639133 RepID=UPI00226BA0BD|nr:hypothetical protein [Citrobacter portucalensis]MCX8980934.1 hypothetical protein [Citrobacter portucalensis]